MARDSAQSAPPVLAGVAGLAAVGVAVLVVWVLRSAPKGAARDEVGSARGVSPVRALASREPERPDISEPSPAGWPLRGTRSTPVSSGPGSPGAAARDGAASGGSALLPLEPELPHEFADGPLLRGTYPDGELLYQGTQIQDEHGRWVRDGAWEARHENGATWEYGSYREGLEDGPWNWWYADGTPMSIGVFEAGERVGSWIFYYPSGALAVRGTYADGGGNGPWVHFHENGLKAAEGELRDDQLDGPWRVWNADGSLNLERTGTYRDGELL